MLADLSGCTTSEVVRLEWLVAAVVKAVAGALALIPGAVVAVTAPAAAIVEMASPHKRYMQCIWWTFGRLDNLTRWLSKNDSHPPPPEFEVKHCFVNFDAFRTQLTNRFGEARSPESSNSKLNRFGSTSG